MKERSDPRERNCILKHEKNVKTVLNNWGDDMKKIGTQCVDVSTAILTGCVGEEMGRTHHKESSSGGLKYPPPPPQYAKGTGQQGVCWVKSS